MDNWDNECIIWAVVIMIISIGLILCLSIYSYKMNSQFIKNGYHQQQKLGESGVIWVK